MDIWFEYRRDTIDNKKHSYNVKKSYNTHIYIKK